jgi:hypothetical protein
VVGWEDAKVATRQYDRFHDDIDKLEKTHEAQNLFEEGT